MHALATLLSCLSVSVASLCGTELPPRVVTFLLAGSVAVVGVPHGALDHLTGRVLLAEKFPRSWGFVFLVGYLVSPHSWRRVGFSRQH